MAWIKIPIGRKGLMADPVPFALPAGAISAGRNFAIRRGLPASRKGYVTAHAITGTPRGMASYVYGAARATIIATDDSFYSFDGSSVTDITATDEAPPSSEEWDVEALAWGVFFTHRGTKPYLYSVVVPRANVLPNWPETWTCAFLREFRSHIFAFDVTDSDETIVDFPHRLRWSTAHAPYIEPATWIPDPTNTAGFVDLPSKIGRILDARVLGQNMVVYCEYGAIAVYWRGDEFIFGWRELPFDDGIMARRAIAAMPNRHVFVGTHDIYETDGNLQRSITFDQGSGNYQVRDHFFQTLNSDPDSRFWVRAIQNLDDELVCIYYPSANTDSADAMLCWDSARRIWAKGDAPNVTALSYGPMISSGSTGIGAQYWDDVDLYWDEVDEYWDGEVSVGQSRSLLLGADNVLYQDGSGLSADGTAFNFELEMPKLDLDQLLGIPGMRVKYIRQIYPQIQGQGQLTIQVGASEPPSASPTYDRSVSYDVAVDKKVDFRKAGAYLAIKLTAADSAANFFIDSLWVDVEVENVR